MKTEDGAGKGMGAEYIQRLSKDWKDYEQTVKEQIKTVMGNQQNMYDSLSVKWAENSQKMRSQLIDVVKNGTDGSQELYNFMRNYQNKLNAGIIKASNIETNEYKQILEKWNGEATKVVGLLTELEKNGTEKKDDPTLMDLYSSWVELSNDMTRQIAKTMRDGNGEYAKLVDTWREYLNGMQEILTKLPRANPGYEGFAKTWEDMALKMGADISRIVKEGNTSLEFIRTTWEKAAEEMRKEMLVVFKDVNYEELYIGFFNRANQLMGNNWPMVVDKENYGRMENDLETLKNKITELEKAIKSRKD